MTFVCLLYAYELELCDKFSMIHVEMLPSQASIEIIGREIHLNKFYFLIWEYHDYFPVLLTKVLFTNRFEALIEREWIQGGHPFKDRCCKSVYSRSEAKTESPIFLLFLDSVWQVHIIRSIHCRFFGEHYQERRIF